MPENTPVQEAAAIETDNLSDTELNNLMFGNPEDPSKAENPVPEKTETPEGSSPAELPAENKEGAEQQAVPENPPAEDLPAEPVPAESKTEKTVPLDVLLAERKKHQEKLRLSEQKYEKIKSQTITAKPIELTASEKAYYERQREIDPEGADMWKQAQEDSRRQMSVAVEGMQVAKKIQAQADTETEMITADIELYPDIVKADSELNKKATEIFEEYKSITGDSTIARIKAVKIANEYLENKQAVTSKSVLDSKVLAVQSRPMSGGGSPTSKPVTIEKEIDRISREMYGD